MRNILIEKNGPAPGGHVFKCIKLYQQSWKKVTQGSFVTNYFKISPLDFHKKLVLCFPYIHIGKMDSIPMFFY